MVADDAAIVTVASVFVIIVISCFSEVVAKVASSKHVWRELFQMHVESFTHGFLSG